VGVGAGHDADAGVELRFQLERLASAACVAGVVRAASVPSPLATLRFAPAQLLLQQQPFRLVDLPAGELALALALALRCCTR